MRKRKWRDLWHLHIQMVEDSATALRDTMQNSEIRLECLKLAQRPGLSPSEVIATAREYLAWVGGATAPTTSDPRPDDRSKVSKLSAPRKSADKPS